ncbi:MAG TPA: ATP-binding protein [Nocardioidaceae bacterium]|nr:ATP-binding protein [Nocardioidaceae bacterium]
MTQLRRSRPKDAWDGPAPLALPAVLYLDADPQAARRARSFVHHQCRAKGIEGDALDTAVLLTSEIVTNAWIHGRSAARLEVTTSADGLLVEVGDENSRLPELIEQDPEALNGRGLAIVSRLAADWGAHEDDWGKVVWFEIQYDH